MAELTQDQERAILAFRERMDAADMRGDSLDEDQILWLISQIERPVRLEPGRVIDLEFAGDRPGYVYSGTFLVGQIMYRPGPRQHVNDPIFRGPQSSGVTVEVRFISNGQVEPADIFAACEDGESPFPPPGQHPPGIRWIATDPRTGRLAEMEQTPEGRWRPRIDVVRLALMRDAEPALRRAGMPEERLRELIRTIGEAPEDQLATLRQRVDDLVQWYTTEAVPVRPLRTDEFSSEEIDEPEA